MMAKDEGRFLFGGYHPEKKTDLVASKNNILSLLSKEARIPNFHSNLNYLLCHRRLTYATDFKKLLWNGHSQKDHCGMSIERK